MRVIIQRVLSASVTINGNYKSIIEKEIKEDLSLVLNLDAIIKMMNEISDGLKKIGEFDE